MGVILLLVLALLLLGTLPAYGYSRDWGYRPAGGLGLLLVLLVALLVVGTVPWGFAPRLRSAQAGDGRQPREAS